MATAFGGLATPPGTLRGMLATKNDHLPSSRHFKLNFSKSNISPIGSPQPLSNHWCRSPPCCISSSHGSPFHTPPIRVCPPSTGACSKQGARHGGDARLPYPPEHLRRRFHADKVRLGTRGEGNTFFLAQLFVRGRKPEPHDEDVPFSNDQPLLLDDLLQHTEGDPNTSEWIQRYLVALAVCRIIYQDAASHDAPIVGDDVDPQGPGSLKVLLRVIIIELLCFLVT